MRTRITACADRGTVLRFALWVAAAIVIPVHLWWSIHLHGLAVNDSLQLTPALQALSHLDLANVFGTYTQMTSPPGIVLLMGPFTGLFHPVPGLVFYATWAVVSTLWLGWCAVRLARRLNPSLPAAAGPLLALVLAASSPTVGGLVLAFHPEDVVATGISLLFVEAVVSGRDVRAGLLLGAALMTRQWALLLVPIALVSPTLHRRRHCVVACATVCCVVLAPFAAANLRGLEYALEARSTVVGEMSLWAHAPRSVRVDAFIVSREGPLGAAAVVGLWLARRWRGREVTALQIAAAAGLLLALRQPFDTFDATYYLLPAFALLVVCCVGADRPSGRVLAELALLVNLLLANQYRFAKVFASLGGSVAMEAVLVVAGAALATMAVTGRVPVPRSTITAAAFRRTPTTHLKAVTGHR